MYAYTFYLFFDFAGYSAFAISISYLFGVHTPENFDRPFLARNIRDFWNRWHITLSFWFRDHVYMRFLLAAARGKWFKSMHTAAILGYFLAFGLMGLWHGIEPHLHRIRSVHGNAAICIPHFLQLEKGAPLLARRPALECARRFITFNAVCFGLLIFSGTHRRCADWTTTARETFDAEGCSLAFRIYREMLVLKMFGHSFGLFRLDLFGRCV
jgi:membrane protein involved in D-alanine export